MQQPLRKGWGNGLGPASPGPGEEVARQQLQLLAAARQCSSREGGTVEEGEREAPEAWTQHGFPFSPLASLPSRAWFTGQPEAEQGPGAAGGRWMGTEHQGEGALGPTGGTWPSLPPAPHLIHSTETPLVQQLHVEVTESGSKGGRQVRERGGRGFDDYSRCRREAADSSYPWEETIGRLILLLVVMAFSSHLMSWGKQDWSRLY